MKTRFALLPIAVALAGCLWAADAMAQAGTMPAGIGTHGTGELPGTGEPPGKGELAGTGELPGTGHRPGAAELSGPGEHPGAARPAAGAALDSAASLRQRALATMEALREEIATLAALKDAQAALLALNQTGSEVGEAPATLALALCAEPALGAWCPLLPATFGTPHMEEGNDRD